MCEEQTVHEEEYKGHTIKIFSDDHGESPREWDNLGTMVCFHGRYDLGDKHDFATPVELIVFQDRKDVIYLPLYLYDHSGITMNTTGFSCPWDSGQVGIIYITYDQIRKEMVMPKGNKYRPIKNITKNVYKYVIDRLRGEVKTYDDYLRGNVYGFSVEKDGEDVDSCWGFLGEYDDPEYSALNEAKSVIDFIEAKV